MAMTGAERARKARRRRKWLTLLAAQAAGSEVDPDQLRVLVAEFGSDPTPPPVDLDEPHEASATVAQAHLTRGGTAELRDCPSGCHEAWREHRRPLEADAARRFRATHKMVPRDDVPGSEAN